MSQPDPKPDKTPGLNAPLPELQPVRPDPPRRPTNPGIDETARAPVEGPTARHTARPTGRPPQPTGHVREDDSDTQNRTATARGPAKELQPVDDDDAEDDTDTGTGTEPASATATASSTAYPGQTPAVRAPGWDQPGTVPPPRPRPETQARDKRPTGPRVAPELRPDSVPGLDPVPPRSPTRAIQQPATSPPPKPTTNPPSKPPTIPPPIQKPATHPPQPPQAPRQSGMTAIRVPHSPVDEAARELARAALAAEIEKEEKAAMRSYEAEEGEVPPSPEVAKRFDVILQLGKGGMGVVYLCRDPRREGKVVAVKDIRTEIKTGMKVEQRVEHEAKLLKDLDHPGIVKVFDLLKFPRGSAIVMEYIDGLPLDHEIGAGRRITWDFGVRVLKAIGMALGYAHDKGVIHRDIKPDNILYSERHGVLKLVDFGLARIFGEDVETHLTRTGMVVGTPHYMSPEQVSGKTLDQRSDVYSFGATLYYLMSGQRHVDGDNVMDILEQQRSKPILPPGHIRRDIPGWVSYVIGKMMEIKLEDRYESMAAVLADVKRAEQNPEGFVNHPPRGPVKRFNGLPLSLPQPDSSPLPAVTDSVRQELPTGTGVAEVRPTVKYTTGAPPAAPRGSTERTRAAANGVLELLGQDEVTLTQVSGLLKEISGRLEKAERQRLGAPMLLLIVLLGTLIVVLAIAGLLLLAIRQGWLAGV